MRPQSWCRRLIQAGIALSMLLAFRAGSLDSAGTVQQTSQEGREQVRSRQEKHQATGLRRPPQSLFGQRSHFMGFTPWLSAATAEAVAETYALIAQSADIITHHVESVPWTEALKGEPFRPGLQGNLDLRKKNTPPGFRVVVSISPLNTGRNGLAGYYGDHDNMPLPADFEGKRFNDPKIQTAYLNYCRRIAEFFHPDYFIIGIEANELFKNTPGAWADYLQLSQHVYAELKKEYPDLPISQSVTLHQLLDRKNPNLAQYQTRIKAFIALHDFAAVSYYPFFNGLHSYDEFLQSLESVRQFTDKPIGISECGHPAEPIVVKSWNLDFPATPEEQNDFVRALLTQAQRDRYFFVTWFAIKDFDALWASFPDSAKDLGRLWRDTGLVDEKGNKRPAYLTWLRTLAKARGEGQSP
ncbi:MAG: hypothetical protein AB1898_16355 [Acidobacteriota bacterium]